MLELFIIGMLSLIIWSITLWVIITNRKIVKESKEMYIAKINTIPMHYTERQFIQECEVIEMIYGSVLSTKWMRKQSYKRFKKIYRSNEIH
jgi:hypothetical protein